MTIPDVQRHGNSVLLTGQGVLAAHWLVELGAQHVSSRDGVTPSPRLRELLAVLAEAAADTRSMSRAGHGDVPEEVDVRSSQSLDPLTTKEAAVILDRSPRQVRRLAAELGAHRSGSVLTFDRAAIEAAAHARKESPR